ncbi:MAG TPA: phosphosulfolactate synthase [Acidimicrobiales bacterium]|nr:phosphosulfolactate synthase [Acidimicrobiales bacterium]
MGAAVLASWGVGEFGALTTPFDPGYDPATLEAHLAQSAHLMEMLKLSMTCWMIADGDATRRKLAAAREWGVGIVTGGGPFEIAAAAGEMEGYLDLCAELGVTRVEAGEGFTHLSSTPESICRLAADRSLEVQFELGAKHTGAFDAATVRSLVDQGSEWLDAGAVALVVEARESAQDVGLFSIAGELQGAYADALVEALGHDRLIFEAPTKPSQFALLDHFGPVVRLSNVRLEEVLRVEIYRRGLHSDAFGKPSLAPSLPNRTNS